MEFEYVNELRNKPEVLGPIISKSYWWSLGSTRCSLGFGSAGHEAAGLWNGLGPILHWRKFTEHKKIERVSFLKNNNSWGRFWKFCHFKRKLVLLIYNNMNLHDIKLEKVCRRTYVCDSLTHVTLVKWGRGQLLLSTKLLSDPFQSSTRIEYEIVIRHFSIINTYCACIRQLGAVCFFVRARCDWSLFNDSEVIQSSSAPCTSTSVVCLNKIFKLLKTLLYL